MINKHLYNIIWEVSFLRVPFTLIFITDNYRCILNELKLLHLNTIIDFLFSLLFSNNIYNKKGKIYQFKNEFKNENIYIYIIWFH